LASMRHKGSRLRIWQGIALAFAVWVVLSGLSLLGAFSVADLKLLDLQFRIRGERKASTEIALVEVDDRTIGAYGRWPLPRDAYALLLTAISDAGARAVGVDLLFLGHDPTGIRSDLLLAGVTAKYPNVVHAISFQAESVPGSGENGLPRQRLDILERQGIADRVVRTAAGRTVSLPFMELLESASALGHVTVAVDRDGGIRRLPLLVRYRDRIYPSLGLQLIARAEGWGSRPSVQPSSRGVTLIWPVGRRLEVPMDSEGGTAIDFAGDRAAFPSSHSMLDVLRWYQEGQRAKLVETFSGKIVLIGNTAVREAATDVGTTPFATATPLVFVHANVINSIVTSGFIERPSILMQLILLACFSVFLGWVFVALPLPAAAGAMASALACVGAVEYILFVRFHLHIPATLPLLVSPVAYGTIASYRFVFLERRSREREKELQVARSIQRKLLPTDPPRVPELDVYGLNIPAQEVGGDYYDWLSLGEEALAVALGDVSGKGVSAALLMSNLQASFHAETRPDRGPEAILRSMSESLFRATEPQRFATFFLATISRVDGTLKYANAGHNPGFLAHDGKIEWLGPTGVPLGMFEDADYKEEARSFAPGDLLVLYSDGVTECDRRGQFYGEERLEALVASLVMRPVSARDAAESVLAEIRRFCHGEIDADDVTLLIVRRR
jgi:serine phosphatase RsbU (regulator of sigma subunit)